MKVARSAAIAAGLATLLAGLPSDAQEWPLNVFAVSPDEEIQDLLFLGDDRPVLIRLHIQVDGMGHRGRWREFVGRLYMEADVDRNGIVSRSEADAALDRVDQLRNAADLIGRGSAGRRLAQVIPQTVAVADLENQMRGEVRPFQVQRQAPSQPSNEEATFRLLDRDCDGFLTRGELADARSSLARLDLDDDEIITAEELAPYRSPSVNNRVVVNTPIANTMGGGPPSLVSEQRPRDMARLIVERYKAKTTLAQAANPPGPARFGTLARIAAVPVPVLRAGDFPIDREAFARIDSNGNDSIDADELEHAITGAADLEVIVRLGRREPGRAAIDRLEKPGPPPPFGAPGLRRVGDLMLIEMASTVIELGTEAEGTDPSAATRANLAARFQSADLDKNGTLDKAEVRRILANPNASAQADRDGDGKLTEAEWRVYLNLQAKVVGLRTTLQASEQGPSFLDLLDANRDRRLCVRELQAAAGRILLEDRDGDDRVSLREFARHHRWTIVRGQPATFGRPPILVDQRPGRANSPAVPSPEWFLKMDRNRDGDLSPREFLGTRATFEGYDVDRDGLIAPWEAIRRH